MSKKKYIAMVAGTFSLALIGNGAYVYADSDSVTLPPGIQQQQKPNMIPEQPKLPEEEKNIPPAENPIPKPGEQEKPQLKPELRSDHPKPAHEGPESKTESKSVSAPEIQPKSEPKSESEQPKQSKSVSHPNPAAGSKSDFKPGSHVVADAGKGKKESEAKQEAESTADPKESATETDEKVKGEKMAKTGFNPVPFAQMAAGLFGLGGTAIYGMRRKSTDD